MAPNTLSIPSANAADTLGMSSKTIVLRAALAGLALYIVVATLVIGERLAALHRFDDDPSCSSISPSLPSGETATGACDRRPITVAQAWSRQTSRGGRSYFVSFAASDGTRDQVEITPHDAATIVLVTSGYKTSALYFDGRPVRVAFRQDWLATEYDPHWATFKTEVVLGIVLAIYLTFAASLYARLR